ncbi:sulfotransferase [Shewanella youngdeokensis]|uniref:Sulfotransferase n=1 Tax=Shewanella youngdeokensis TaxID=2999068 RepID=A0ABZ0JW10_9GAMM|nr:sulfotransferase [Shewanella sp. DAU334]
MNKVFIIGLPRTGTTSISVALLDYGFKVAHTAYTKRAFELADVISDSPCFCDYQQLDRLFPNSKFVYLERELSRWVPSMQMLINKMQANLDLETGIFNPVLKRTFNTVFKLSTTAAPDDHGHLIQCYQEHKQAVLKYFEGRHDLLCIDISQQNSLKQLLTFLNTDTLITKRLKQAQSTKQLADLIPENDIATKLSFPHLNRGRQVACWKEYKHPNKVNSNAAGKEQRKFFNY